MFNTIDDTLARLHDQQYIAERNLATAVFLSLRMNKPLFLEGEAGVGKTEIAKVLARALDAPLIRMQCYEGLDVSTALYEWNYPQQMLYLRMLEASGASLDDMRASLFTREFLQARPLLRALEASQSGLAPVLLIDELDRADEEFEAFLLELLSDFTVTIPELGTLGTDSPPVVIITSNRTREIHDALKRRCIYFWIDYPDFKKELSIIRAKAPGVEPELAALMTAFVQELRQLDLFKSPGVAETIDWVTALIALDQQTLSPEVVEETIGVLLKYQDDIEALRHISIQGVLERARMNAQIQA
jgi:MoxR-like ATPase